MDVYCNRPRVVLAWAMYDFANTIYSAVVVTAFIGIHVKDLTGRDAGTGVAHILSMMGAGLLVPLLGAWSDRGGRTKRGLLVSTLVCCAACMGIAFAGRNVGAVLACFVLANLAYQVSLLFYDSLLPTVATPERMGLISGLGLGLGSLGMAAAVLPAFQVRDRFGIGATFFFAGAAFLVFSLPTFLVVRERPAAPPPAGRAPLACGAGDGAAGASPWRDVLDTLRRIRGEPAVCRFLLGNFLCFDALNATILFYVVFLRDGIRVPEEWIPRMLLASSLLVVPLGLFQGWLSDRVPAWRVYLGACGAFLIAVLTCGLGTDWRVMAAMLVVCGATALSGIQATGRRMLAALAPPDRVGAYFGFYELTNKLSGVQSLLFALAADAWGYRVAVLMLAFTVVPGAALVWGAGRRVGG